MQALFSTQIQEADALIDTKQEPNSNCLISQRGILTRVMQCTFMYTECDLLPHAKD